VHPAHGLFFPIMQEAWVFAEPVDVEKHGLHDYHTIIAKPMDLRSVLATKALARAAPLVTSTCSALRCKLRRELLPVCSAAACTAPSALWSLRTLAYTLTSIADGLLDRGHHHPFLSPRIRARAAVVT
jgi:hypothetical protein